MVLGSGQYKIGEDLPAGVYTFKFVQNGDSDVSRTDYYVYENESMYKYDVDRLWLGDMPRVEGSFKGDGETVVATVADFHNAGVGEGFGDQGIGGLGGFARRFKIHSFDKDVRAFAFVRSSEPGHGASEGSRCPIIAVPMPTMTVRTSAKSRLIRPSRTMRSTMQATPECSTRSAS